MLPNGLRSRTLYREISFFLLCVHSTCEHSSVDCKQESLLSAHLLGKMSVVTREESQKKQGKLLRSCFPFVVIELLVLFGSPDYKKGCSAGQTVCLSVYVCLSVCLSVYLSVCLSE